MSFTEINLKSWNEIHDYQRRDWIYRGQKSAAWPLRSSFERLCDRWKIAPSRRLKTESHLRREFARTYHLYGQHIPKRHAQIEWMSLMQHHGTPTRLLDFTYSIYIAAYFALEDAEDKCAVWAVDGVWVINQSVAQYCKIGKSEAAIFKEPTSEKHEKVASKLLFDGQSAMAAVQLSPFQMNERLRTQRGTFLAPGDVSVSFENNIQSLPDYRLRNYIVKIVISKKLRKTAIIQLNEMNISRASLFPGLDGYAQSLGVYHPAFSRSRHGKAMASP